MKILIITMITLISLVSFPEQILSQEKPAERKIGISALLQGGQLDIILPMWAGSKTVIAPALSVAYVEDAGTDLGLGIAPRFYLDVEKVGTYLGGRAVVLTVFPDGSGDTVTDFLLGVAMGGEYFLNAKFSFGVEAQGNFTISDDKSGRFGNPGGFTFNTATAVFATIYF